MSPVATVIFDGECRFCIASLNWLRLKADINAHPFQSADLASLGVTKSECEKEVIAIIDGTTYRGASAIAQHLAIRGNRTLSRLITYSGKFGDIGYHWVATHRNSIAVKALTIALERAVR
jgi:predicted DCC family thiol-disulfide oxidoreductase YuxK